jgi:protein-S-isoprenylcysteine O-methyltransferase Ste14
MDPVGASLWLWGLWVLSWVAAALWTRRTVARQSLALEALHRIPTALGGVMMVLGAYARVGFWLGDAGPLLWRLPSPAAWALTFVCAAGFGFTWWARLTLGDLWSSGVARKEDHVVVETGPYGLVRHPIYTGLIVSAFALALQTGELLSLVGAALLSLGFWVKASLEERLLSETLGPAYADYRRRTPMLAPFWPTGR